ncbi:MAG: orotate phosphoribosyltransferase [Pseudobdellovibrio sp.]
MTHAELAISIDQICHLKGDFLLRSGSRSHEYFDKYRFESQPILLKEIAEHMKKLIPKDTEILAALEMGGIPIGTALSLATGLPCAFIRKSAKEYGTCQFAEGIDVKGKKLCIIEDVITSGGQVLLSAADLRSLEADVRNVICVINRGGPEAEAKLKNANLSLGSLFTRTDFGK